MRSARAACVPLALAALLACGGKSSSAPQLVIPGPADNVLRVTVNGSLCSQSYLNKPCVEVKVCAPGSTTACQTIPDILVDTGSYGLRVFSQVLTVSLPAVPFGSGTLATCVQYADGAADWGPVRTASIVLSNEPAVEVPIHVIDATFSTVPDGCGTPETGPAVAGFNGVLGVGPFAEDCGPGCAAAADNGVYYSCDASVCTGAAVPVDQQIQNPVAHLPQDGNGVMVFLPAVPLGGAPSVDGALVLGIGTRTNNGADGASTYALDGGGNFSTTFDQKTMAGFVDTGSNGLYFPAPSNGVLPSCTSQYVTGFFCPSSTVSLSAMNAPAGAPGGSVVGFQIGNFERLVQDHPANWVFPEIGGNALPNEGFDWGLPFHLGRRVAIGIEGRQSPLGVGPYAAY